MDETLPSVIPPFRQFVAVLDECEATGSPLDLASRELDEADLALGNLCAAFEHSLVLQVLSPEEAEAADEVLEAFAVLRGMLGSLHVSLAENDPEAVRRDVDATTGELRVLEEQLALLREAEARRPVYSGIPAVNELIRAGRAVLEGQVGWDLLAARLESVRPLWEAAAREGRQPEAGAHGQAYEELARAIGDEEPEALEAALESLRVTGEALQEAQSRLEEGPEEARVLCPRCGASVGEYDRTCPSCSARMPERVPEEVPGVLQGRPLDLPDYLQVLFQAAERLQAGEAEWPVFQAALAEARRRSEQSLALLERVAPPPTGAPVDERECLKTSQEAVENGLQRFFEGIDDLESLAARPEDRVLERGLEALLLAVGEIRMVGTAWQRLVEGRGGQEI